MQQPFWIFCLIREYVFNICKKITICNSIVNTLPVDGETSLGARSCLGIVMTKCVTHVCTGPPFEVLMHTQHSWIRKIREGVTSINALLLTSEYSWRTWLIPTWQCTCVSLCIPCNDDGIRRPVKNWGKVQIWHMISNISATREGQTHLSSSQDDGGSTNNCQNYNCFIGNVPSAHINDALASV